MKNRLITEEDLARVSYGDENLTIREKARRLIRGLKKPTVLKHLATTAKYMRTIRSLYARYPDQEHFEGWYKRVMSLFEEFDAKLHSG